MTRFFVSGLINIETTLRVDQFPIGYEPSNFRFFGINNTVSGVGFNIAKALKTLASEVDFLTCTGQDVFGRMAEETLAETGISTAYVHKGLKQTAQSIILFDSEGRRSIFTDLKDVQDIVIAEETAAAALKCCDIAVLCNINFSRRLLQPAKKMGKTIATDVHTIASLDDEYNADFMAAADILFLSDEHLPVSPEDWAHQTADRYGNDIVVIGLGRKGALLYTHAERKTQRFDAILPRPVVNTIGAGDSLFSSFLHFYAKGIEPQKALQHAIFFAGYKIGSNGAAEGFLPEKELLIAQENSQGNSPDEINL